MSLTVMKSNPGNFLTLLVIIIEMNITKLSSHLPSLILHLLSLAGWDPQVSSKLTTLQQSRWDLKTNFCTNHSPSWFGGDVLPLRASPV